jgi:hypothetical protein
MMGVPTHRFIYLPRALRAHPVKMQKMNARSINEGKTFIPKIYKKHSFQNFTKNIFLRVLRLYNDLLFLIKNFKF